MSKDKRYTTHQKHQDPNTCDNKWMEIEVGKKQERVG